MKLAHLSQRFVRALWPAPPRADDLAWAASILTPAAMGEFRRLPNHDQRHALGVARAVQTALAGSADADDERWLSAALLHDIGKLDARLGVYGRVVATVSGAVAGRRMADAWSQRCGLTRRIGLYLRHPELGASRIRLAGGPEEAARWAEAHHAPESWETLGLPPPVVAALDAADND
ncbi:MAG TPA: HD domain-containing protein [Acidimicrobiia bacterium]